MEPASVTLSASASDPDGSVSKVSFFRGSVKICEATAAPYGIKVDGLPAGKYYFSAQATDDRGATALATSGKLEVKKPGTPAATNKLPKVSLKAPVGNSWFVQDAPVTLSATASDPDGTVTRVEYFADAVKVGEASAPPWSATWPQAAPGAWSITAVATDDRGGSSISSAVAIFVAGPAAPVDARTRDAARFLTQATFGMRGAVEIDALRALGYEAWLESQRADLAVPAVAGGKQLGGRSEKVIAKRVDIHLRTYAVEPRVMVGCAKYNRMTERIMPVLASNQEPPV